MRLLLGDVEDLQYQFLNLGKLMAPHIDAAQRCAANNAPYSSGVASARPLPQPV
jgi:hypothetical protein